MSAPSVLRVSILSLLFVPVLAVASQRVAPTASDSEYSVMSRFLTAVDAYVVEHHRFEALSEGMMCLPQDTLDRMNALAEVPREARRSPREGDIFTADVADLFTQLLATTFAGDEDSFGDAMADISREELIAPPIRVNERPPRGIGHTLVPSFDGGLPPLPEELEYRLVGRQLVLVDVESNLVVDVIRDALPIH